MPPKAEPKKDEERKLPPPKPKIYEDEKTFRKAAKEHLKTVEIKPDGKGGKAEPAKDNKPKEVLIDKNGKVFEPAVPEIQYNKDDCKKYVELCFHTWLEDKDIEEMWDHKIKRTIEKDGKKLETVGRKALKHYALERAFEKHCIR